MWESPLPVTVVYIVSPPDPPVLSIHWTDTETSWVWFISSLLDIWNREQTNPALQKVSTSAEHELLAQNWTLMLQTEFSEKAEPSLFTPATTKLFPTSCKTDRLDRSEMKPSMVYTENPWSEGFSEPAAGQGPAKGWMKRRAALQGVQSQFHCCRSSNLILRASDGSCQRSASPQSFLELLPQRLWAPNNSIHLFIFLVCLCWCECSVVVSGDLLWQCQSGEISHQRCPEQRQERRRRNSKHTTGGRGEPGYLIR